MKNGSGPCRRSKSHGPETRPGLIITKPKSIIVSVKINDGIVMAADSATTFYKATGEVVQIYEHANKIVNLVKGFVPSRPLNFTYSATEESR